MRFEQPLWLIAIAVGVILAVIPFFRIRKDKRYTRERIVSMILHVLILTLASFVLAGFSLHEDQTLKNDETLILIDVSDSNYHNSDEIADYINKVINDADAKNKVGIVAFGAGKPHVLEELQSKPKVDVGDIWALYDNPRQDEEGFIMTTGTDMASAISFAAQEFTDYDNDELEKPLDGCRMIILSDGIETDGDATTAAGQIAAMGAKIDAVYFEPKDYSSSKEIQIEGVELSTQSPKPLQAVEIKISVKTHSFGEGHSANFKIFDLASKTPEVPVADFNEDIIAAEQIITGSAKFAESGLHTIKVEMTPSFEVYDKENYEENSLKQNNVYYTYLVVQDKTNKILIIKGKGADATALRSLIDEEIVGENGYEITEIDEAHAPTDVSKYGEVILLNCNSSNRQLTSKLPDNYDFVLKNYVQNGGSVLTMGGKETYYNANMGTDAFNEFLPVSVKPKSNSNKAMILLIDRSSGMCGEEGDNGFTGQYGKNRLQVVQEAFSTVLGDGTFSKDDYVGVIFFGGNKYTPIEATKGLIPASNIFGINRAVGMSIAALTGGKEYLGSTDWRHALEKAVSWLQPFQQSDNKHIIMITDGAGDKAEGESSNLTGYPVGGWKSYSAKLPAGYSAPGGTPDKCYTDFIYDKYGITTSTINVGNKMSPASSYIEFMETASQADKKTHYYYTETAQQIADAVTIECKNIPTKIINEGTEDKEADFYVKLQGKDLQAIAADSDIPVLHGYNGVSPKDKAAVMMITGKDPIYASWEYGKGIVSSFMTDISTNWGKDLLAEGNQASRDVIKYMVDKGFKANVSGLTSDMNVEFNQKNFTTTITIKDISKEGILPTSDGGKTGIIESYYHSPSDNLDPTKGSTMNVMEYVDYLCPENAPDYKYDRMIFAAGTFTSNFRMMEPGLYTVAFLRCDVNEYMLDTAPPYAYVTFSYSEEYDTYYDAEKSRSVLADICNSAKGQVFYADDTTGEIPNIFSDENQFSSRDIDPVWVLMLLALILFVLDICARKFHFPLPHDLFKKDKAEA